MHNGQFIGFSFRFMIQRINSSVDRFLSFFSSSFLIRFPHIFFCHGVNYSQLSERVKPKSTSYGNSQILPKDYLEQSQVEIVLREMTEKLSKRLRSHEKLTGLVHISIRYFKYETTKGFQDNARLRQPIEQKN
ncbi:hypothetical protein [Enterococcus sp. DIV0086]|uniref:DinB/UmuC family translesion DNA polymerase n=1 Tax=Enterococcus sp. DIV0086 TaxID=2774655 RepID=UPI003D2B8AB2